MHLPTTLTLLLLLPLLTLTADIHISVSNPRTANVFTPASTTASPGDVLIFSFLSGPHDVAQSSFDSPCHPAPNAFYSGLVSSASDRTFRVEVNSSDPIFFYCAVAGHCQAGMVGVVNPPPGQAGDALTRRARGEGRSGTPDEVSGGTFGSAQAASGSSVSASPAPTGPAPALDIRVVGGGVMAAALAFAMGMM